MEPGLDEIVKETVENDLLSATTDSKDAMENSKIIMVIVPTPVDQNKKSDLLQLYRLVILYLKI